MRLVQRDLQSMQIKTPDEKMVKYKILQLFPFTSENKRMGIIVQVSKQNFLHTVVFLCNSLILYLF